MGNFIMFSMSILYIATLDGLKIISENEKINDITEIDITLNIINISLVIQILSFRARGFSCQIRKVYWSDTGLRETWKWK